MSRAEFQLPPTGSLPFFTGATTWLNSPPLAPPDLVGKVVLVNFWTYTCVNWLRTLPYVRAWAEKYKDYGLVVIGVHTPEFAFEHNIDNVEQAMKHTNITYPVVVDNNFIIWNAFVNHYWPALYFVDAQGRIRYHQFGEGEYEMSERVIQQLLVEAGAKDLSNNLVSVEPKGAEVAADWESVESPETYLGYERALSFNSFGDAAIGRRHSYSGLGPLSLNQWTLSGDWTIDETAIMLHSAHGKIIFRFHARDLNLVMGPVMRGGGAVPFRVQLDERPPRSAHGADTDDQGNGTVVEQRMYQLVRQPKPITDRQFEIEFLATGIEGLVFTFG